MRQLHNDDTITLELHGREAFNGTFVAYLCSVDAKMVNYTKRELQKLCRDFWPELFKTVAAREELRTTDKFILAVVTSQK